MGLVIFIIIVLYAFLKKKITILFLYAWDPLNYAPH